MGSKRTVSVGGVKIGGGNPVTVQSMLSVRSTDTEGNLRQAKELETAGCEILRVAMPDFPAVRMLEALKRELVIPLVADIHFDYRLAVESAAAGADKIRINPGNIGGEDRVKQVADACKQRGIPIRVGVNSGSVEKEILAKHGGPTAEALLESAVLQVRLLERFDFTDIVVAIKSSNVPVMVRANRLAAEALDYPLHLGVTEAGTERASIVKSSAAIGALLLDGIGDTIRVSMTADPVREVYAAKEILRACGVRSHGAEIISCPTCGRTRIDLIALTNQVEEALADFPHAVKVAVMGCAVNGPGEAREADIGIAGGDGEGLLFRRGVPVRKIPQDRLVPELLEELARMFG